MKKTHLSIALVVSLSSFMVNAAIVSRPASFSASRSMSSIRTPVAHASTYHAIESDPVSESITSKPSIKSVSEVDEDLPSGLGNGVVPVINATQQLSNSQVINGVDHLDDLENTIDCENPDNADNPDCSDDD